jgi:hypothetical protein
LGKPGNFLKTDFETFRKFPKVAKSVRVFRKFPNVSKSNIYPKVAKEVHQGSKKQGKPQRRSLEALMDQSKEETGGQEISSNSIT